MVCNIDGGILGYGIKRFSLAGPQAAPLTGALEEVQEGVAVPDARHDHIRRVDINGRITSAAPGTTPPAASRATRSQ